MLHREESPGKPQYNMATCPFLDKPPILPNTPPPFLANILRPSISINFEKVESSPLYEEEGGVRTMFRLNIFTRIEITLCN